ncbi:uncharacterized protein [Temnothorax nylanderi]|uniref:uncharacterized protein n=1 Tax=Temnothorax nylanderi TaxID=102681 RepID=UPI003A87E511
MFCSTYIINYNAFWMNTHNVKRLTERLQQICNELKDENEINIMKEYGNSVKRYTVVIILFSMCCLFIVILLPILTPVLDIALHINGSQPRLVLHFMTEYFIDQEKYFYIILLHSNAVICIGATTMTATGTLLRGYLIHACGLFKIASYRIEQAMTIKMLENISTKNEIMIYKEIICAVDIQRKALKYSQFLLSSFKGSIFFLIAINVISLSLNLFAIFQCVSLGNKEEFVFHLLIVSVILLYMFLASYTGQEVIDHNNYIYIAAYNVRWNVVPVHTQKLILFILRRSSKAFALNVGQIFVASLECFATLLKASMSYFTFMYSMQQ